MQMIKKIALVGRANVGKSTIFNRLSKRNSAIVDKKAGITRDRKEGEASLLDLNFMLIDTAGIEVDEKSPFAKEMNIQSAEAIDDADILFFVISAKNKSLDAEKEVAEFIRKIFKKIQKTKPVVLIANKSENVINEIQDFNQIGFGEPSYISAEHNVGFGDVYGKIADFFYKDKNMFQNDDEEEKVNDTENENHSVDMERKKNSEKIKIAIIGRPNVGKSTLLNTLVGENRVITSEIAGTTTDSVNVHFKFKDREIELVDTAGKRKSMRVTADDEKLFSFAAERAIKDSHVAILVVDAESPFEKQDLTIADIAIKEGKPVIVALNKWDLIESENQAKFLSVIQNKIGDRLAKIFKIIPISALKNVNISKMIGEALVVYGLWNKKIITNKLNLWLNLAVNANAPVTVNGKTPKLNFVKQVGTRPPSFAIFGSRVELISDSYVRYLANTLAKKFRLENVPVRIFLRQKDNPYHNKTSSNRLTKEDRMKRSSRMKNTKYFTKNDGEAKNMKHDNQRGNKNTRFTKSTAMLGDIIQNAMDIVKK